MKTKMTLLLLAGASGAGKSTVEQLIRDKGDLSYGPLGFGYDSECNRAVTSLGMADPIKQFASDVFQFSHDQLYGPSASRNHADPRWSSRSFWADADFRIWEIYGREFVDRLAAVLPDLRYPPGEYLIKLMRWLDAERGYAIANRKLTARRILQTLGTEYGRDTFGADVWVRLAIADLAKSDSKLQVITDGRFENEVEAVKAAGGKVWLIAGGTSKPLAPDAHASERWITQADPNLFDHVIENPICPLEDGGTDISQLRARVQQALSTLDDSYVPF